MCQNSLNEHGGRNARVIVDHHGSFEKLLANYRTGVLTAAKNISSLACDPNPLSSSLGVVGLVKSANVTVGHHCPPNRLLETSLKFDLAADLSSTALNLS